MKTSFIVLVMSALDMRSFSFIGLSLHIHFCEGYWLLKLKIRRLRAQMRLLDWCCLSRVIQVAEV